MTTPNTTPRTDAAIVQGIRYNSNGVVTDDFARQLETELNEALRYKGFLESRELLYKEVEKTRDDLAEQLLTAQAECAALRAQLNAASDCADTLHAYELIAQLRTRQEELMKIAEEAVTNHGPCAAKLTAFKEGMK